MRVVSLDSLALERLALLKLDVGGMELDVLRGGRELLSAFSRWSPRETVAWFEARGVALKTEADGRMFPVTDDSQTIIECLRPARSDINNLIGTRGMLQLRGDLLPIVNLGELLDLIAVFAALSG